MSKVSAIWSQQEENLLKQLKEIKGIKSWTTIAKQVEKAFPGVNKTGKQCRERYINFLCFGDKQLNRQWSHLEQSILYTKYLQYGPKWKTISQSFQYRSQNNIKNKFYSSIRKIIVSLKQRNNRGINLNSALKLCSIFEPDTYQNNSFQRLLKYKELREILLKIALYPDFETDFSKFFEDFRNFNTESRFLNSLCKKNKTHQQRLFGTKDKAIHQTIEHNEDQSEMKLWKHNEEIQDNKGDKLQQRGSDQNIDIVQDYSDIPDLIDIDAMQNDDQVPECIMLDDLIFKNEDEDFGLYRQDDFVQLLKDQMSYWQ